MPSHFLVLIASVLLAPADVAAASPVAQELRAGAAAAALVDPARVIGPGDCGECHEREHARWHDTLHARGFTELSLRDSTRALATALGLTRVKREASCIACHFLPAERDGDSRPVSGVACESCHGAGRDWVDIHWDFGPNGATAADETPEHRAQRWSRAEAAGMVRPRSLVALASRCLVCHLVDDERLVATGGHPVGGAFDLLERTQGEIRHNFLRGGGERNVPAAAPERRLLRVVGRLLDLEVTARALARANPDSPVATGLRGRIQAVAEDLRAIAGAASVPELGGELLAWLATEPRPRGPEVLNDVAEAARVAAIALAARTDGSDLAGLDPLLGPAPEATSAGTPADVPTPPSLRP